VASAVALVAADFLVVVLVVVGSIELRGTKLEVKSSSPTTVNLLKNKTSTSNFHLSTHTNL
jgi:hypothetical protein